MRRSSYTCGWERAAGRWRVVGVEDLGRICRPRWAAAASARTKRRLRSDLRNLATAQEMYFTGHASYSPSLQALTYSASPGVRLEIIAASSTGWRAGRARTKPAPPSAAIGVGTGVPPGERGTSSDMLGAAPA